MNCRPGDLAFVVRSKVSANIGKMVRVLRASNGNHLRSGQRFAEAWQVWTRSNEGWIWLVECESGLIHLCGDIDRRRPFPDDFIRPIRPGDISDEEVRDLYAPKVPEAA